MVVPLGLLDRYTQMGMGRKECSLAGFPDYFFLPVQLQRRRTIRIGVLTSPVAARGARPALVGPSAAVTENSGT